MRDPEASDFCYYPFFQVLVTAEGKYRPCSKHVDHITHQGKVLTTANATLGDAWNSDYMQTMRADFHANRKFPGCAECWRLQKIGLRSMRYDSYQYDIPESQVQNPVTPSRVEINSSNVCNMKCRICFATASTQWLTEAKKLYGFEENLHNNLETDNLEQVKAWSEHLQELCLFGGEPLLLPGNIDLLDHLIREGYAPRISLLFNTNGTIFNEAIAERLRKFRRVRISFSIDDIGPRFEYQRKGGVWKEVEANLKSAWATFNSPGFGHVEMKICCTVSMFNAYYLPEFFDYFNREFPGLKIFFNYLFDPTRLCVQILPDAEKQVVVDRIRGITPNFDLRGEDGKLIENIITYIQYREQRPFDEFFHLVNRHDVYRSESFPEVFPEFWDLIKKHKPAGLVMGRYEEARPGSPGFEEKFSEHQKAMRRKARNAKDALNTEQVLWLSIYDLFEQEKHFLEDHRPKLALLESYTDYLRDRHQLKPPYKGPGLYLYMTSLGVAVSEQTDAVSHRLLMLRSLLEGPLGQDGDWHGRERLLGLERSEFHDILDRFRALPVDAYRMGNPPGADALLREPLLQEVLSGIRSSVPESLPASEGLHGKYAALALFESRKKLVATQEQPALYAAYGEVTGIRPAAATGPMEVVSAYLNDLADTALAWTKPDEAGHAADMLRWMAGYLAKNPDLPEALALDLLDTPREDLFGVFGREKADRIVQRIEEQYLVEA